MKAVNVNIRKISFGVVSPDIHVPEAVNDQQWKVFHCFADVVERMCELKTISRQHSHHV